jgi:MFS family permease
MFGASVTALCMWVTSMLLGPKHLQLLTALLFFGGCVVALVAASCGGLMATMLSAFSQSRAAGWNQAGNFGGGVLGAALVLWLAEYLSPSEVGLATAKLRLSLPRGSAGDSPRLEERYWRCCGHRGGAGESSF